jgi:beta-galactosidase
MGDFTLVQQIVDRALSWTDLNSLIVTPEGVEVTRRMRQSSELLFILNHTPEAQQFHLDGACQDILSGVLKTGDVSLAPCEVLILKEVEYNTGSSR